MLRITLPFVTGRDISLLQTGDELVVHTGPYRRMVYLPRALANLPVGEAELEDRILTIRFREPQPIQPAKRKKSGTGSYSGGGEL
jgi:arsenite-transporting ATPase